MKSPGLGFAGRWTKFTVRDADLNVLREYDGPRNLITDIGLDAIGNSEPVGYYCRVGTGTTTPANANTALVSQLASTANVVASTQANAGAPNYQTVLTRTYRFAFGAVDGNVAEIGVGWGATGDTLFSRARILDSGGSPTTISVGAGEIFDATYELTCYPDLTDHSGTVVIGPVTHSYVARFMEADQTLAIDPQGTWMSYPSANTYDGSLGAVTASPSGSAASMSGTLLAYTAGNHYRDFQLTAGITQGNVDGGIDVIAAYIQGSYGTTFRTQMSFDPPIEKDGSNELSITLRQPWSRH